MAWQIGRPFGTYYFSSLDPGVETLVVTHIFFQIG
jgi:hypothetical protein